jgi:hypothetical protein
MLSNVAVRRERENGMAKICLWTKSGGKLKNEFEVLEAWFYYCEIGLNCGTFGNIDIGSFPASTTYRQPCFVIRTGKVIRFVLAANGPNSLSDRKLWH